MLATLLCGIVLCSAVHSDSSPPATDSTLHEAYEAAKSKVGRNPEAQIKLALWCEAHGLKAERMKHLAIAVLSAPSNATARGLLGLVAYHGRWKRPDRVGDDVKADAKLAAALAEYNARRGRTPEKADAHWALAVWCEQNGLEAEALAHFTVVTRLDPTRAAAWKRLGCKKVGGRWMTQTQLAAEKQEADAQKKAEKHWTPLLTKWRGALGEKTKRAAAEAALAEITDSRAVSSVWSVFVVGSPAQRGRAVQILGQIDAAGSSRALAFLAVFDNSADVRRAATETLRRRDPREFAGMLVALIRDPIKYEVRPVGGPGSPGVLFVEGKQFNVRRFYAPPAMPNIALSPNDQISLDANGLPIVNRFGPVFVNTGAWTLPPMASDRLSLAAFAQFNPLDPTLAQAAAEYRAQAPALWDQFFKIHPHNNALLHANRAREMNNLGVELDTRVTATTMSQQQTQIPIGQMMVEYRNAALGAQQQLAQDVAAIDNQNRETKRRNERAVAVLKDISGQDRGEDHKTWDAWWVDLQGYAYTPTTDLPRPTVVEDVPLAYTPQAAPQATTVTSRAVAATAHFAPYSSMPSCFGAGTRVRTLDGSRPIELIKVGDRVLTQDIKTGALGYHPVTVIHHNPPSPTFLVKVGADTIVSSPFHRFWITGKGWVMARNLKAGDLLRLLDGPSSVESVESGPVQPVFNLDVSEAHDFFAGAAAALVHDNTLPETRLEPFDLVLELNDAKPPAPPKQVRDSIRR